MAIALTEVNHQLEESEYISVLLHKIPVKPTKLVILAVGVVVALLRASDFITSRNHRYALGEQKNGCEVFNLSPTQCINFWVVSLSFNATIPAQIVIDTILIILAISFIVLVVIRDQIIESEPIMTSNEINAVDW